LPINYAVLGFVAFWCKWVEAANRHNPWQEPCSRSSFPSASSSEVSNLLFSFKTPLPGKDEPSRMVLIRVLADDALFLGLKGAQGVKFGFLNKCPYTVWAGTLSGAGSSPLAQTGFELASGASANLIAPAAWSGRFWGRTNCAADASGLFKCGTADCGSGRLDCNGAGAAPPATLLELTLGTNGGQDFYDVSLVDGYNLPASLAPQGGQGSCAAASCPTDVNRVCPRELQAVGSDGTTVVACKSACEAFGDPKYCCTGDYGNPTACKPTGYSQVFKNSCPLAYSYAYDDATSTFTCTGADYLVTFCP
ncbi:hypothetical protein Taro_051844, partial [Colocasia esculenta]|nr:hypothetical protein [Colocasia esculenta]